MIATASARGVQKPELASVLESSTQEVFRTMMAVELVRAHQQPIVGAEFTAMVGLAGQLCGLVTVRCSQTAAILVASLLLHVPVKQSTEHAWDALGEVANMVAGNFKNKLDGVSEKCMLSLPTVVTGADYSFRSLSAAAPVVLWFTLKGKPLAVSLHLQNG